MILIYGISNDTKINQEKINKIKKEREKKKQEYQRLEKKFESYCDTRKNLIKTTNILRNNISIKNWEDKEAEIADIQQVVDILDLRIDELMDKLYNIKK